MSILENEADRQNERRVAIKVADKFKCETVPTETLCPYDFVCIRNNKRVALLEVRARNCFHDTYSGLWMSVEKHKQLITLSEGYGDIPVIFVLSFQDGDWYVDITKLGNLEVQAGNRGPNPRGGRGRKTDYEPVLLIPGESLTIF